MRRKTHIITTKSWRTASLNPKFINFYKTKSVLIHIEALSFILSHSKSVVAYNNTDSVTLVHYAN